MAFSNLYSSLSRYQIETKRQFQWKYPFDMSPKIDSSSAGGEKKQIAPEKVDTNCRDREMSSALVAWPHVIASYVNSGVATRVHLFEEVKTCVTREFRHLCCFGRSGNSKLDNRTYVVLFGEKVSGVNYELK